MYFLFKALLSGVIIAIVTKLSDNFPVGGALVKSLPLTSFLVFFIMKYENKTNTEIAAMSWDILWMVIPSLLLFIILPLMLTRGFSFSLSLISATVVMSLAYLLMFRILA